MTLTTMKTLTGATISLAPESRPEAPRVIKSGGSADLQAQYKIMERVGSHVFPNVYYLRSDSYCMEELLCPPVPLNAQGVVSRLEEVRRLLASVWCYAPLDYERRYSEIGGWQQETNIWLYENARMLQSVFRSVYKPSQTYKVCLIHGDPTLSNVMLTNGLRLRLIDPAPPRFGVPQLPEVDLGKLLQSLVGWEALFIEGWPKVDEANIRRMITQVVSASLIDPYGVHYGHHLEERAIFWGAFHCMRAAVRYNNVQRIREWGLKRAEMFIELLAEKEVA